MEEYTQLTIDDWIAMKSELEEELKGAAAGFVRIGYLLRQIEEQEGYKRDGYKSLAEWAKDTYGLSESSVSRFIAINKKYSIDGYSKQLRLEFAKFGQAKLAEMLTLSDEGLEMVSPEMKREDIRELKRFEREAQEEDPVQGETDCPAWIIHFIEKNDFDIGSFNGKSLEAMIEEVNPYGTRMYREGATMVSMLRDRLAMRTFPHPPERMEWQQFFDMFLPALEKRSLQKEVEEIQESIGEPAEAPVMEKDRMAQEAEKKLIEAAKMPEKTKEKPEKEKKVSTEGPKVPKEPEKVPAEDPKPAAGEGPEQAAGEKPLAPAQEHQPANVEANAETVTEEAETEPEQVEIAEIMPAPAALSPVEEFKDRFGEALNSLRVMLDADHYEGMGPVIERLGTLWSRIIEERSRHEKE